MSECMIDCECDRCMGARESRSEITNLKKDLAFMTRSRDYVNKLLTRRKRWEANKQLATLRKKVVTPAQICPSCKYVYLTETPVDCENAECKNYNKKCVSGVILFESDLKHAEARK